MHHRRRELPPAAENVSFNRLLRPTAVAPVRSQTTSLLVALNQDCAGVRSKDYQPPEYLPRLSCSLVHRIVAMLRFIEILLWGKPGARCFEGTPHLAWGMIAAAPPCSPARPSRTGLLLAGTFRVIGASAVSTGSSPDEGLETAGIGFCPQQVPMRWTNDAASPTGCVSLPTSLCF